MRHRVADNYGAYNDIQLVDLNNDGRVDILTSVIKRGASRGHVISYNLPDDFVFGQWKRTVLAAGFDREGKKLRFSKIEVIYHAELAVNWREADKIMNKLNTTSDYLNFESRNRSYILRCGKTLIIRYLTYRKH